MTRIGLEKAPFHGHLTLTFDPEIQKIGKLQSRPRPTSLPKMEPLGLTVLMLQTCTNERTDERKARKYNYIDDLSNR